MSNKNPLAYARVIDKIKLPEKYHRGKKLFEDDRKEVRKLYKTGKYSYRELGKMFDVSAATIQTTVNEKARQQSIEAARKYHKAHQEQINLKNRGKAMELRRYKKDLIIKGIIKL